MNRNSALRRATPLKRTGGLTRSAGRNLKPPGAGMVAGEIPAQGPGALHETPVPGLSRTPLKRGTRLRPVSDKRTRENRERRAMLAAKYPARPLCEVPWCTRWADDAHEPLTRARGGSITDPENVAAICRPHHDEITFEEPGWAYELGLLVHSWNGGSAA